MKKIRYLIETFFLGLLLGISKMLPPIWASNLGGWLGRHIGTKMGASHKARKNIQMVFPDKTNQEIESIIHGMWDNLGRVIMEYPHIKTIAKNHTEIIGVEIFKKYAHQSPIFISAHLGNWEVCPPAFWLQTGIKVNPVYRAPNNPFVDKMLNKIRTVDGALTPIPKSRSGTRHMLKTLQNHEGIGLLIDQKFNEGVKANFFGHPAMTSEHFIRLSQKLNCPIIPLQIERINGIDFRITISEPIHMTPETSTSDTLADIHTILEKWISQHPEQWLWLHRRWMSAPELKRYENEQKPSA